MIHSQRLLSPGTSKPPGPGLTFHALVVWPNLCSPLPEFLPQEFPDGTQPLSSPNFPILLAPRGRVGSDWDTQSRHLVPLLFSSGSRSFSGLPGSFTFSLQTCSPCSCLSRCRRLAPGQQVAPLHPEISERWICCDRQWQEGLLGPLRSVLSGCASL